MEIRQAEEPRPIQLLTQEDLHPLGCLRIQMKPGSQEKQFLFGRDLHFFRSSFFLPMIYLARWTSLLKFIPSQKNSRRSIPYPSRSSGRNLNRLFRPFIKSACRSRKALSLPSWDLTAQAKRPF